MVERITLPPGDGYNETLVGHVHPADWKNPVPAVRYNLVVIGAGTAGLVTAAGAAGLGAKVALVERHLMGGDCLNSGCVPSKGIIAPARVVAQARRARDYGIATPDGPADFAGIMARMRKIRGGIAKHDSAARFSELGVHVFLGEARFLDSETVAVGDARLRFKKAVIATGARAAVPPVPGLDSVTYYTNESIFGLTELPPRLLVLGGGPIGCELAQAFQRLGSRVTLAEQGPRIMPREDGDAAEIVRAEMEAEGVHIRLETALRGVGPGGGGIRAAFAAGDSEEVEDFDVLLIATGRAPNVAGLGLETVGVAYDERAGVHVDDTLRTANPAIFACGDVCQPYKFTHAADAAARIVIRNALFPFLPKAKFSKVQIPWCTYTDPEVAHIGITEQDAAARGIAIDTYRIPMSGVDRAILEGEDAGLLKVHTAKGKDRILGATMVSAHAGESIGVLSSAMTSGLGLKQLAATIFPYPTQAEAIKKAADAYGRSRLSPGVARLFARIMAWQR